MPNIRISNFKMLVETIPEKKIRLSNYRLMVETIPEKKIRLSNMILNVEILESETPIGTGARRFAQIY